MEKKHGALSDPSGQWGLGDSATASSVLLVFKPAPCISTLHALFMLDIVVCHMLVNSAFFLNPSFKLPYITTSLTNRTLQSF